MTSPKIGILVVAYNAENHLRETLSRIPHSIRDKISELFVFDDASPDQTHEVGLSLLDEWQGKLSIFKNPVNLMYGGNQRKGYQYAIERNLDIVVLLHADGQYSPEVMGAILQPLIDGKADMVMGSRMLIPGAALRGKMPPYKYYGNKILTFIENALIGQNFSEFHSGYRAYNIHALKNIPLDSLTSNWHFDTQIILEFLKRKYRIAEVPIPTYYGDEICHVNGIPYAMHCVLSTLDYALFHRWRNHASLSSPSRSPELPSADRHPPEKLDPQSHP